MAIFPAAFVDSNILIYAALKDSAHFSAANTLRERAQSGELQLCFTPQILAEFFAILTDPRRVSESRTPEEVLGEIEKYLWAPGFTLLPTPAGAISHMIELCRHHPVSAQQIFDLQIIASMLAHDIKTIYTFNKADFEKFEEIKVIVP